MRSKASANQRALVHFALPAVPAGCTVTEANLRLNATSATNGRTLQAVALAAPWTEGAVSWSNQPATTGTAATTASGTGWREWTVTAQVNGMYTGANHGFLIRDASEGSGATRAELRKPGRRRRDRAAAGRHVRASLVNTRRQLDVPRISRRQTSSRGTPASHPAR